MKKGYLFLVILSIALLIFIAFFFLVKNYSETGTFSLINPITGHASSGPKGSCVAGEYSSKPSQGYCCFNGNYHDGNNLIASDNRFLCYNGQWYENGWEYSGVIQTWVAEKRPCEQVGSWYASNTGSRWINTNPNGLSCGAGYSCQNGFCKTTPNSGRVSVQGNKFMLNGQEWNLIGTNFFPSGFNQYGDWFAEWWKQNKLIDNSISGGVIPNIQYKDQVRKELDKIRDLGYNTITVGYDDRYCQEMIDLLKEADSRGLKVLNPVGWTCDPYVNKRLKLKDVYSGAELAKFANPNTNSFRFNKDDQQRCENMFTTCKDNTVGSSTYGKYFYEFDSFLGYDLVWEPGIKEQKSTTNDGYTLGQGDRHELDWAFTDWVITRYGSLQNAINNWGYNPGLNPDGSLNTLSDQLMCAKNITTGNELSLSAGQKLYIRTYKGFLGEYFTKRFGIVNDIIRKYDSKGLITLRTSLISTSNWPGGVCMDFPIKDISKYIDILPSEGYGIQRNDASGSTITNGNWDYIFFGSDNVEIKTAYSSNYLAYKNKPFIWMEWGLNAKTGNFPGRTLDPGEDGEQAKKSYYQDFILNNINYGANGYINWWNIGGARLNEGDSDYGIYSEWTLVDKPVVDVLKSLNPIYVTKNNRVGSYAPNDYIIIDNEKYTVDSKKHLEAEQLFRTSILAGKRPTVRSDCYGTNSDSVAIKCYGNKNANTCPQKCLKSNIASLRILDADGVWQSLTDYTGLGISKKIVKVKYNSPLYIQGRIDNIGETTWKARSSLSSDTGAVRIAGNENHGLGFRIDIPSDIAPEGQVVLDSSKISNGITADSVLYIQLIAEGRTWFGDIISVNLQVVNFTQKNCSSFSDCGQNTSCSFFTCETDSCIVNYKSNFESCGTGLICNGFGSCVNQSSLQSQCNVSLDCGQSTSCSFFSCEEGRCILEYRPDGTLCDDGVEITKNDVCTRGFCEGAPYYAQNKTNILKRISTIINISKITNLEGNIFASFIQKNRILTLVVSILLLAISVFLIIWYLVKKEEEEEYFYKSGFS